MNNLIFSPIDKGQLIEELSRAITERIRKEISISSLEEPEYLTIDDVAKLLKKSRGTIRNYTLEGLLNNANKGNGHPLFLKSDVLKTFGKKQNLNQKK